MTNCMARIEHFSVGVNSGVYSIFILNRLAGGFIIERHEYLTKIIEHKRIVKPHVKHYDEFDKMVDHLKFIRKIKGKITMRPFQSLCKR